MKTIPAIIAVLILFSCSSSEKKTVSENIPPAKASGEHSNPVAGWSDNDTYTVHVSAVNLDEAIKLARHKILKDIVNVRMLNDSRYTDITMIQEEFKKPLENGRIINPMENTQGIDIWFQIHDEGLKEKFERK